MGRGSVLSTGASPSLRGKQTFAAFPAGKSGLPSVSQSMTRELGPRGIHVAHIVVDGSINGDRIRLNRPERYEEKGEEGLLSLEGIAEAHWQLHHRLKTAWTHELDQRPFKEPFWPSRLLLNRPLCS